MKFVIGSLTKLYSALLHLYPVRFRNESAEEMQVVFNDSMDEAVAESGSVLALGLRVRAVETAEGDNFV